jgi:uncharacterized protein (TIGR03435 family)
MKAVRFLVATIISAQISGLAQTEAAKGAQFEVASIKPSAAEARGQTIYNPTRERFAAYNITAKGLVAYAYDVREFQISGGPRWFETDPYDILAKPQGDATSARITAMVRSLLQERFGLRVHPEPKDAQVLALVVARGGPKLRPSAQDGLDVRGGHGRLSARAITMQMMAAQLSDRVLGRVVVDRTGINGRFDIELTWAPDENPDSGPSIFTALQEQLGLRLEPQRGTVDMLVIDRVERPSAN